MTKKQPVPLSISNRSSVVNKDNSDRNSINAGTGGSRFVTQLQDTTAAVRELQQSLQPFLYNLQQQQQVTTTTFLPSLKADENISKPSNSNDKAVVASDDRVKNSDSLPSSLSSQRQQQQLHHGNPTFEQNKVVAQTIVALTTATICYLKPHLLRTSNKNCLTTTKTSSSTSSSSKEMQSKQQKQIRSDLNHLRQLLNKVQECHNKKRKENSVGQQNDDDDDKNDPSTASKRIKRPSC